MFYILLMVHKTVLKCRQFSLEQIIGFLFRFIAEDQTAVLTITVNSTSSNGLVSSKST